MANERKIFIGCLPSDTDSEEISKYFSKYCTIINLEVKIRKNGVCAGFGHLVCEASPGELSVLLSNTHTYRGRNLEVREYLSEEELNKISDNLRRRRIHVSNLPEDIQDEDLSEMFKQFGPIDKAYVANRNPKKTEIYGFVVFVKEESLNRALKEKVTFRGYTVSVNTTQAKGIYAQNEQKLKQNTAGKLK